MEGVLLARRARRKRSEKSGGFGFGLKGEVSGTDDADADAGKNVSAMCRDSVRWDEGRVF